MRTAKCLVIVLVLATMAFGANQELSETRDASCIVRITADYHIIPLNSQTVTPLVLSSAVTGKAAREVLGLDASEVSLLHDRITVEWLSQAVGPVSLGAAPGEPSQRGRRRSRSTGLSPYGGGNDNMDGRAYDGVYGESSAPKDSTPPTRNETQTDAPGMMMGGRGGGMGMGGMYGSSLRAAPDTGAQQNVMLRLSVRLPDDIKPAAEEFLTALVEETRQALLQAYERQSKELQVLADFAASRRHEAQTDLEIVMGIHSPSRTMIEEQLSMIVDLSMLTPEMPFSEAVEQLKNAVDPPLPIVVLWKELLDNCDIEPTTPIDMDGLPSVKLETALRMLVEAISGGFADLSHQIDNDVIVVREEESQKPPRMPVRASVEADLGALTAQRRDLAYRLQRLEMDFATGDARRRAIQEQIAEVRNRTMQKLENDVVTQELEKLVEMTAQNVSLIERQVELGQTSRSELAQARQSLTKAKIDLALRREELAKSIGGNRLSQLNEELGQMAIDTAGQGAEMEIMRRQLAEIEDRLARASTFDPQAARIRIARQALDMAEARVIQLTTRLASLQRPTVAVIGAN